MDLSEQSITGRRFELNRRGYDPDTVDGHLAEIAAAVVARETRMAELEETVASLSAKVQDANESEEALRLTLKAAAHAKEELLAGAREQAKEMVDEATSQASNVAESAKNEADSLLSEATNKSTQLLNDAETRSTAIEQGARERAVEVARAALSESEALVARIEELRTRLEEAESALSALRTETTPQIETARVSLDNALQMARETANNPELLAMADTAQQTAGAVPVAGAVVTEETDKGSTVVSPAGETDVAEAPAAEAPAGEAPVAEAPVAEAPAADAPVVDVPATEPPVAEEARGEQPTAAPDVADHQGSAAADEDRHERHLEVVEAAESTAEISDKVDRLLEELREVT